MSEPEITQAINAIELAAKRKRILAQVCEKHGYNMDDLTSKRRFKDLNRARQEAMYRLRKELPLSLPRIARIVGRSDHTCVINGINKHCARNGLEVPK